MTRRPSATVRVVPLPDVTAEALRVEVTCVGGTTGITYQPSTVAFDVPALTAFAIFQHGARCEVGCNTSRAHGRGDPENYEDVGQAVTAVQNIRAQHRVRRKRN